MSSSLLDEVAPTQSSMVCKGQVLVCGSWRKIYFRYSLRRGWRGVGVARSHFGSNCNVVDLFVIVVAERKTVEGENQFR